MHCEDFYVQNEAIIPQVTVVTHRCIFRLILFAIYMLWWIGHCTTEEPDVFENVSWCSVSCKVLLWPSETASVQTTSVPFARYQGFLFLMFMFFCYSDGKNVAEGATVQSSQVLGYSRVLLTENNSLIIFSFDVLDLYRVLQLDSLNPQLNAQNPNLEHS